MLAQKDGMIKEATDTIIQLTRDEQIRQRCEARADYLRWQKIEENYKKELEEKNKQLIKENKEKDALIAELKRQLQQQTASAEQ